MSTVTEKQARFSKAALLHWVNERLDQMEAEYGFHTRSGWAQVEGKGEVINRAYGQYDELINLREVWLCQ